MTVHLEGMGVLGSLTAIHLDGAGIPFTWTDNSAPHNAWCASTGLVYPAGDRLSRDGLAAWIDWLDNLAIGAHAEEVRYVYQHKRPPHEGTYANRVTDLGDMRVAPRWRDGGGCVAVSVQGLVRATRDRFAHRFVPTAPDGVDWHVTSHGFNRRMRRTMWGWAAAIHLSVPADLTEVCGTSRPAFYSRRDRFQIVYAYPIPGTDRWWAGSALIRQDNPHPLDADKHFGRWLDAWRELWPRVPVVDADRPVQGWRPRPTDDTDPVRVDVEPGRLTYPPLWHSGVRWAPHVIRQTLTALTEEGP